MEINSKIYDDHQLITPQTMEKIAKEYQLELSKKVSKLQENQNDNSEQKVCLHIESNNSANQIFQAINFLIKKLRFRASKKIIAKLKQCLDIAEQINNVLNNQNSPLNLAYKNNKHIVGLTIKNALNLLEATTNALNQKNNPFANTEQLVCLSLSQGLDLQTSLIELLRHLISLVF
ncbi:MAG: hypothetical protein E7378_03720 [Clostridiales bacterium]|nr:hypothetical protein [Clostridiales bacterium]